MICRMLWTLHHIILQNSKTHLRNSAAFYKTFKECPTTLGKLYDKEFKDVVVQYRIKFLKIVRYIFYFNQMVFKFSFKKWIWSYCFCIFICRAILETCSTWRYRKLGRLKIYFRFIVVVFAMPCWVMMIYYLKLILSQFWYCVISNSNIIFITW